MEILRLSNIEDIVIPFTIPLGHINAEILVVIKDLSELTFSSTTYENKSSGDIININLPGTYDNHFRVFIFVNEIQIFDEIYSIIRPYVNPEELALNGTASEIEEYKNLEMVARSIIDTFVDHDGFYNKKQTIQTTGQGGDYLPLWQNVYNILKVYENNTLVYSFGEEIIPNLIYQLTVDKTAIQRYEFDTYNRSESAIRYLNASGGDIWQDIGRLVAFPSGYDYTIILDAGYKHIPEDVQYATKLLIEDLKCGKLEYYKRYTTNYSTDQYKIQFDKAMFDGTGNLIVDKILDKYRLQIKRIGII